MEHQTGTAAATTPPRLLDQVRGAIRTKHYSPKTEEAYVHWARKFILFHNKRHPIEMGEIEVGKFLQHLAVNKRVAASTQNQALNALVFLYGSVLKKPLGQLPSVLRAKRPKRLPSVLRQEEVQRLFAAMKGPYALMARFGMKRRNCGAVITFLMTPFNVLSAQRGGWRGWKSRFLVICCVTRLPRICWSKAATLEPFSS